MADEIQPDDLLKETLRKAFNAGSGRSNYVVDIAGNLGTGVRSPTLTNLPNTLVVSSHGGRNSGFSPDKSATNELSKVVSERIKKGGELTLEDIASSMGSATNDIKRAIISACFAAGYNFSHVKSLFPNLEQLVAPSTELPSSAVYDRYLTRKDAPPLAYTERSKPALSPLFSITPNSTNAVTSTADYLPTNQRQMVEIPPSLKEKERDKLLSTVNEPSAFQPYSSKPGIPSSLFRSRLKAISDFHKDALSRATNNVERDLILQEVKRRIATADQ